MRFNLPVLVYQEKNCVHNHADEIAQMGKNALIVTGRNSSKKNGSLDIKALFLKDTLKTLNICNKRRFGISLSSGEKS